GLSCYFMSFLFCLLDVANLHKCLIRLEDETTASGEEIVERYTLKKGVQVIVYLGDITKQEADALVNAANEELRHGGGVALALSKAGGPKVQRESNELIKNFVGPSADSICSTGAGLLGCREIVHVQTKTNAQDFNKTCKRVLKLCESKGHQSVAFPAINTGVLTDIDFPEKWSPMAGETFKKVELDPSTEEFQSIAKEFYRTTKHKIHKIERVQNHYLWCSYFVMRKKMLMKNGAAELGEKHLYHGTSAKSCNCANYGKGVYFAVNASYSARDVYSEPDDAGLKRMYVARVLTGRYTEGEASMKAPPPRGKNLSDRYDSLVDSLQNPEMFVIFHDDQAYPEYLITFS
uniref:Poly [ADP-ribose] polymerase n=1 Tax=Periophthalmus magnuspinnatus TaxID=409849 RepID=A0A3B3ZLM5_9GOBI